MTTISPNTIRHGEDWKDVLVAAHIRSEQMVFGQGMAFNVEIPEHVRRLYDDGRDVPMDMGFCWEDGELSAELIESMADVLKIPTHQRPPKRFRWDLKTATYFLSKGLRYKRGGKWVSKRGTEFIDLAKCMDWIDGEAERLQQEVERLKRAAESRRINRGKREIEKEEKRHRQEQKRKETWDERKREANANRERELQELRGLPKPFRWEGKWCFVFNDPKTGQRLRVSHQKRKVVTTEIRKLHHQGRLT